MSKLTDDLIITCRTTCGCGNKLIPYTKQTETTHYLLTCDPYSDKYNHPLLIAIDMNSPVFVKARKYDTLMAHTKYHNTFGCQYHFEIKEERRRNQFLQSENQNLKYERVDLLNRLRKDQKLRELIEEKIEDFASRKLPHVVIHELQKLLEDSKK